MDNFAALVCRVDASIQMGTGHVMRCIALAQAWISQGGVVYFCTDRHLPVSLKQRLQCEQIETIEVSAAAGSIDDARETIGHCDRYQSKWIIIDGYHFNADYQNCLKSAGLQLLVIDDYGHLDRYHADLILNQNISASRDLYANKAIDTRFLLGCKYALLRQEFWLWRSEQRYKLRAELPSSPYRLLITLGGSDPHNVTSLALLALKNLDRRQFRAKVIIGGSNPHRENLHSIAMDLGDAVSFYSNVADMPQLLSESDIAISAAGSTCWELAFMGIPNVSIVLAANQESLAAGLDRADIGTNLGWYDNIDPHQIAVAIQALIDNPELYHRRQLNALALVDGYGGSRVIEDLTRTA
jgi:UDP-2,4-diacetamido-2,4,6-trideoxy-beta-L-altropyranose hydrolase